MTPVRFTLADVERAHDLWGANCGPVTIAAIAQMLSPNSARTFFTFEEKRYSNPTPDVGNSK